MLCESCGSGRDPLTHTSLNPWEWEGPSHTHTPLPIHGGRSFHTSPAAQLPDQSHLNTLQDNHREVRTYTHAKHSRVVITCTMHART